MYVDDHKELSIYIHIPFCRKKCTYCDFISFAGCDIFMQREYVEAVCKEISAYSLIADKYRVVTIYVGGGTPSYIPAEYIGQILDKIRDTFTVADDAEITIEGNPDSLLKDKLIAYKSYGINRLSIGLQSTNDEMLKILGRVHNYDQFVAAYSRAREAGFDNINIDIMSGLPGESMDSYVKTLAKVVEMQPDHISAYSLIVEEGTPLSENDELLNKLPSEELDRKQYARTKLLLGQSGYERYEISNYSKRGCECKHNLVYWTGGQYLGIGLNAASYIILDTDKEQEIYTRFHGVLDVNEYVGRFIRYGTGYFEADDVKKFIGDNYRDIEVLDRKSRMEEYMFLGLRCIDGVSFDTFLNRFGVDMKSIYSKVIEKYTLQGYMVEQGDRLKLSDKGLDVSNTIMADFLL